MIDDRLIVELFDNKINFKAFIAASHGIPRDLMSIFQKCSLRIRRDFKNSCIDYKLISDVSKDIYRMQKRKAIDPSSISQKLLNLINSYLEDTGRRLFLVDHSNIISLTPLRKLVDEGLIHPIPSAVTHRRIRETYRAYHIDYGNFADWIETEQKDIKSLLARHSAILR